MEHLTNRKRSLFAWLVSLGLALLILGGCTPAATLHELDERAGNAPSAETTAPPAQQDESFSFDGSDFSQIPAYTGEDYVLLNNGVPSFTEEERNAADGTEIYSELDELGRAGTAFAKLCEITRPAPGSKRNKDMPDPSGFVQAKYPQIDLDHLYERSHLIAYALSDEAVNPRDLITGTNHLNQEVMRGFEERICRYLESGQGHDRHVLMRVTPDFRGSELVARGVQIEALSLDDDGKSLCINVYCYNVQPDVVIDYATGTSRLAGTNEAQAQSPSTTQGVEQTFILNTNTKRFHYPDCSSVHDTKAANRKEVTATYESLIAQGYQPCSRCHPQAQVCTDPTCPNHGHHGYHGYHHY